jgi:hypothetical protein
MTPNYNRFALLDDEAEDNVINGTEMTSESKVAVIAAVKKKKKKKKKKTKQEQIGPNPQPKTANETDFNVRSSLLAVWTILAYILTFEWLHRTSCAYYPMPSTILICRKEASVNVESPYKKDM